MIDWVGRTLDRDMCTLDCDMCTLDRDMSVHVASCVLKMTQRIILDATCVRTCRDPLRI